MKLQLITLKDYEVISNADNYDKTNKYSYLFNNKRNIKFIISKKSLFKEYDLVDFKILSENHDIIDIENSISNRINSFPNESFDNPLKNMYLQTRLLQ